MDLDIFRYPGSPKIGPMTGRCLSEALLESRSLVALLVRDIDGRSERHAVTLYKKTNKDYVFKNSQIDEPEIRIPVSTPPHLESSRN